MNLTFVRSFVALVENGSFQLAAQRLGLAQPTISQHIKKLEEYLDVVLIERSRTKSEPTAEGLNALPMAQSLLKSAERFTGIGSQHPLMIGASGNIAGYYLAPELARFQAPGISESSPWQVDQGTNSVIVDKLKSSQVDVAITEWCPRSVELVSTLWRTEPLVVIVPPDHRLANRTTITWSDVMTLPIIGGESGTGTGTLLRERFGSSADQLEIRANMGSTEAVKCAVISGLGCSIVLMGAVATSVQAKQLIALRIAGEPLNKSFFVSYRQSSGETSRECNLARFLCARNDGARH